MRKLRFVIVASVLLCMETFSCKKASNVSTTALKITGISSAAVGTGDPLTVYGTGFSSSLEENKVTLGDAVAEVAVATLNKLVLIVPSNAASGRLQLTTNGQSAFSDDVIQVVTVLNGGPNNLGSVTLSASNKYLLRGRVLVSDISIPPGTTIFCEKQTNASLTILNTANISGTQTKPIVFTSDQPAGRRKPGDWTGVIFPKPIPADKTTPPFGVFRYVRVEFAGSHSPENTGAAILFGNNSFQNIIEYVQVSQSAGEGFDLSIQSDRQTSNLTSSSVPNVSTLRNLIAYGCAGTDFAIKGKSIYLQFGLGLKDPTNVDPLNSS